MMKMKPKRSQERRKHHFSTLLMISFLFSAPLAFLLGSCAVTRVSLEPLPAKIKKIEGYASLKIRGAQGSSKSKFSFLFILPHQGRIDAFNFLGKTLFQIFINNERTFFVLPSKKVYWQGEEGEALGKLLGFQLNYYEMVSLLRGKWDEIEGEGRDSWALKRDLEKRIISGQRDELQFEIREFFAETSVARLISFQHPLNKGRLKILDIKFNRPLRKNSFSLSFLEKYERKCWNEIENILTDEN
jgi:hypothetical protein